MVDVSDERQWYRGLMGTNSRRQFSLSGKVSSQEHRLSTEMMFLSSRLMAPLITLHWSCRQNVALITHKVENTNNKRDTSFSLELTTSSVFSTVFAVQSDILFSVGGDIMKWWPVSVRPSICLSVACLSLLIFAVRVYMRTTGSSLAQGISVGYTTVWSGIYECNEYIPLQTVV